MCTEWPQNASCPRLQIKQWIRHITAVFMGLEVRRENTLLTSYLCFMSAWKWKNGILGMCTVVRYHFEMPKSFNKLPPPFFMWVKQFGFVFLWYALLLRAHSNCNHLKVLNIFSHTHPINQNSMLLKYLH